MTYYLVSRVVMPFVSEGMHRAAARGGRFHVAIYR